MWGKSKNTKSDDISKAFDDEKAMSDIILDNIDDGMVLLDSDGLIRKFNPAAANITGWKQNEALGLDWQLVFKFIDSKGELIDADATPFGEVFRTGQVARDKTSLISKSGTHIALSISASPLGQTGENHTVRAVVAVFSDVSKERQEETQRAEFISTASHEMRTPVAAIEGYLSLALNPKVAAVDQRARGFLEKAYSSTQHLGQLFQDLLTSARAEDGRLVNHPEVVEIGGFMEQLADELKFVADKKGLDLEYSAGNNQIIETSQKVIKPLYYTLVDPDRLKEVITNLFDNAVKYTSEGKITLGLTGDTSVVQISIKDTGAGIPREEIPHLFQKFYRVDNSATRTIGGTGLGLFICRKIIELYQGKIWVESEINKGSTFYVNLPRLSTDRAFAVKKQLAEQSAVAGGIV